MARWAPFLTMSEHDSNLLLFRLFLVDDMPVHLVEYLPAPTDTGAKPHRLVCETEAKPATATQTTKWRAPESSSPVGLPY